MSWNSSIQFAKLYKAYLSLSTTALTNPMIANLNMATYNINNVNTINASAGTTLTLNADSAQGVTISSKLLIPNHPLVITNNTVNDSLQVYDTTPDTTIFRVDHNGNVSIKADPSTVLTEAFTVNGQSTFVGVITCSGLTCGLGSFSGFLTAPTRSLGDNTTNVATTAFVQSAITSGKVSASSIPLNTDGSPLTITASQIGNAFLYNNTPATAHTLYLPNATALATQFGANAVVNFFIGQMNVTVYNPSYPNIALSTSVISPTGNEFWANNYTTQASTSPLTAVSFTAYTSAFINSLHFPAMYKVQVTIQGGKAFYYFEYAGFNYP
jgi:hypothetical protein